MTASLQAAIADEETQRPVEQKKFMVISTGPKNSDEYILGSTLCKILNSQSKVSNIYCSIIPSGGAVMNVDRLRRGNADFIILKDSQILKAVTGSKDFLNPTPYKDMRIVLTGFTKDLTILVSKQAPIEKLSDLLGYQVNIESGTDGVNSIIEMLNSQSKSPLILSPSNMDLSQQLSALCTNKIQVVAFQSAHKSDEVSRYVNRCGLKFLSLDPGLIQRITIKNSYLVPSVVASKSYEFQTNDILTIGEGVTVVATKNTNKELVNNLVQSVIDHLTKFKNSAPFLKNANVLDMRPKSDLVAHYPGIDNYYEN
jgi:TRAP transporter TAXI family solute receptor